MKILLEAFVDTNFGDNLFIHTVVTRYPRHTFYLIETAGYEESYRLLALRENNLVIIPKDRERNNLRKMDGMLIVGGDMLFDGSIYRKIRRRIRGVKKNKGFVAFLGLSLFPSYCMKSRLALRWMFGTADYMVVREQQTCDQIRAICPGARVRSAADMAFATDVDEIRNKPVDKGVLGISVRRKIQKGCDTYENYCQRISEAAMAWLDKSETNVVRFFALSCGVFDDQKVADDIISKCAESYGKRMSCIAFDGDVEAYVKKMQSCERWICTRFHALVFAVLLKKPFVPVVYEEKMERLLDEIGYCGKRPTYEALPDAETMLSAIGLEQNNREYLRNYLAKADSFFGETDEQIKEDLKK